jgi:hypothetical protein
VELLVSRWWWSASLLPAIIVALALEFDRRWVQSFIDRERITIRPITRWRPRR